MKIAIPQRGKWPLSTAAVVSDAGNLHMHLKELVRSMAWRLDDPPAEADLALGFLENGTSFLFVVDDTKTLSAYESIRAITSHPAGRLTPIVALLSEVAATDTTVYQRVLHVSVAKKPLTPNQFLPAFRECIKLWETPLYMAMRRCGYGILNGEIDQSIPILKKLMEVPQAVPYCAEALVQILVAKNEWKEAEAILMSTVKMFPRMPSLMMTVANFYLSGGMPAHALRFFTKLRGICNNTPMFAFDIAQAALSLGQLDTAIEALTEWNKYRPGNDKVVQFISRLYISDGRESQLEKLLNMNKNSVKKLQEAWEKAEDSTNSLSQSA